MKIDLYTKAVLTVIAASLVILVLQGLDIPGKAYAKEPMPVSIVKVGLKPVMYALPVEVQGTMLPR